MQHVLNHDGMITQSVQLIMTADKAIDETDGIYSGLKSLSNKW